MAAAATLDLIEPEIAPFDPPSPNTSGTKHEVDRMTRCEGIVIRNFPRERSMRHRLIANICLHWCHNTSSSYVKNISKGSETRCIAFCRSRNVRKNFHLRLENEWVLWMWIWRKSVKQYVHRVVNERWDLLDAKVSRRRCALMTTYVTVKPKLYCMINVTCTRTDEASWR